MPEHQTERTLTVGSLFSGIGGLDLGLERAGMRVKWQCEIDPYCRAVLRHHWPELHVYEDIHDIDATAERVDLICGGFPCQPVSLAGKGLAQKDPRWLWPEFARVIRVLGPRYVLVENVPGLAKRGLLDVISSLAAMGFDAEWEVVSAAACGAPHLRERLFVVATYTDYESEHDGPVHAEMEGTSEPLAHPGGERRQQVAGSSHGDEGPDARRTTQKDHITSSDGEGDRAEEVPGELADFYFIRRIGRPWYFTEENWRRESAYRRGGDIQDPDRGSLEPWGIGRRAAQASSGWWWTVEPDVGRVAHGVPNRLAQLRALGNAVVPQVAEAVGRMILASA